MEFEEKQQLKLQWLYILLGLETIVICSILFLDKGGMSWQDLRENYFLPILAILFPYVVIYFVTKNSLTLRINPDIITYRYWPFSWQKSISWAQIDKIYLRKYDALGEYGGWGVKYRLWFKFNDKAYIFNDKNIGLQLELDNHKKILFSTGKQEELNLFLINLKQTQNIGAIETNVRER
ncbi:MAG: hypothetical protein V4541_08725 [Bacteroidota bacterium]